MYVLELLFNLPPNIGQTLRIKWPVQKYLFLIFKVIFSKNIATISRETVIKYHSTLTGFKSNLLYGFNMFPSMCDELF